MSQPETDQHTADQWKYHMDTIKDVMRKWAAGEMTTYSKRRAIAQENSRYYGDQCQAGLLRTGRRYELPGILADAAGVDEEVMVIALNARREREGGAQAYADILATAGHGHYQPREIT